MLLSVQNLSFAYGSRPILRDLAMQLREGELVALLGANGSGKTTLIRALLSFIHASGTIDWVGKDVRRWARRELATIVAYLPQSPTFEPGQTVFDVLRLGRSPYMKLLGLESARDFRVIREVAESLELTELLDVSIENLSGGQRQRVFVGRCLAQEPRALVLDEPATHLDLKHQLELHRLLKQLAKQKNLAVLMTSHELNLAIAYADRALLLTDGHISAEGSANQPLSEEALSAAYGVHIRREGKSFVPETEPQ